MPENEKSFIEQEELKMERRQFFKVSAKYGFTTAVVAAAGSSLMSGNAVAQTAKEEKERRESVEIKDDFQEYFNGLNELTNKNPQTLQDLLDISSRETNYREHKSKIKNLINKIEGKENILTKKRIQDIVGFRNTLNSSDLLSNKKKLSRCF